jgi:hypothetical protein
MNILYASILKSRFTKTNIDRVNITTQKSPEGVTYSLKTDSRIFVPILDKRLLTYLNR